MKNAFKILTLIVFVFAHQNADAQLLKKLRKKAKEKVTAIEDKVVEKLETKSDEKIDDVFEGKKQDTDDGVINNKQKDFENKKIEDSGDTKSKSNVSGSAIIKHSNTYGNFNIEEFGKSVTLIKNDEVRIYGSWVTMSADIQDGYVLVIPNGQKLLFDDDEPKQEQIKLRIPEDAQLELSYDPVYDPEYEDENGFSSAVTTDYQSYNIDSGEVTLDVLSKENLQISFSGDIQLVTRSENPNKNSEDRYLLSYSPASVSGMVDVGPISFIDSRTIKKSKQEKQEPKLPNISNNSSTPGIYNFTFETVVKVTNTDDNEAYNISYLLNPSTNYIGMKADMSEYSDEEMDGESIIIMDNGDAHIFVETQGMKMRMSSGMMGNKQQKMPTDQMANYDYTNLTKTGKSKTILGATCFEYVMSDDNVKMELWVAPEVNLPNWFIQNDSVLKGHIMEYTITSKDGNMKSETIAINDNISKTINPKDYKKMF